MEITKIRTNLVLTENEVDRISQAFTDNELQKEKKHRELERQYSLYTNYAFNYISVKTKNIKYADFMQRRITYEGWKYMVRLIDSLFKGAE